MKKIEVLALAVILVIASLLRFPLILQGFFAFTYDQGRDLLEVEKIIYEKDLKFIGPTTGLPGIFYGPWWYYFLLPIFLISNGDPALITLSFSLLGTVLVIASYFFLKNLTKSIAVAFGLSLSLAMSQLLITHSSQIWSPSLILPLMLIFMISLFKLIAKPSKVWFFILGLSCGLILDSEAAYGVILTLSTITLALFNRKKLVNISSLNFVLALLLTLLPRIIFEIKNNFLMTKSMLIWLSQPAVFQEKLTFLERIPNRLQIFNHNFAQAFTQSNDILSLIILILVGIIAYKNKSFLKKDYLFKLLISLLILLYFYFTIFPDAVWDYYLVGVPAIEIVLLSLIFKHALKKFKPAVILILITIILFNFNKQLLSPISLSWEGDGAVYRNQKFVIDSIQNHLQGDYSLHFYTPAMFDYPFDYLVSWYIKRGLINIPRENQKNLYLVIRDDNSHLFMPTGWYGDKTKDKTKLIEQRRFPGNIIFEKHIKND